MQGGVGMTLTSTPRQAACAEYQKKAAAAAAEKQAREEAAQKVMAEIQEAMEVATADDESKAPEKQLAALQKVSAGATEEVAGHMATWLASRLSAEGSGVPVKLKTIALLDMAAEHGSAAMKHAVQEQCMAAFEAAAVFECEPHAVHGTKPQELVRSGAQACRDKMLAATANESIESKLLKPLSGIYSLTTSLLTPRVRDLSATVTRKGARADRKAKVAAEQQAHTEAAAAAKEAAAAALAAGAKLRLEDEEQAKDMAFVVDNDLWVVSVVEDSLASKNGIRKNTSHQSNK